MPQCTAQNLRILRAFGHMEGGWQNEDAGKDGGNQISCFLLYKMKDQLWIQLHTSASPISRTYSSIRLRLLQLQRYKRYWSNSMEKKFYPPPYSTCLSFFLILIALKVEIFLFSWYLLYFLFADNHSISADCSPVPTTDFRAPLLFLLEGSCLTLHVMSFTELLCCTGVFKMKLRKPDKEVKTASDQNCSFLW